MANTFRCVTDGEMPEPVPEDRDKGQGGPSDTARRPRTSLARRRGRRRLLIRSTVAVVGVIVVVVGSAAGYVLYRLGQIHRLQSVNVVKVSGPSENILLIGSTSRCAATQIKEFKLQCQQGVNGVNSDVVLIAHLDPSTGTASLLSIPRDTFIPNARSGGQYNRIDAALADGPDQLVAAIEEDFGIPINHFVELNFASFENVVNALGGIHIDFPYRVVDASSGLFINHTGCVYLNGAQALALVRSRHLYWFKHGQRPNLSAIQQATDNGTYLAPNSGGQYDGTGDLGRITRVHLFLDALFKAVKAKGLGNPLTDNSLIGAVAPNLTVDSTFGDSELAHLALSFRHLNLAKTPELTLPVVVNNANYRYEGYSYGDVVFPTEPQDQATVDRFLGQRPPGLKVRPSSITVSVIDGTNSTSATSAVETQLAGLGFRVVPTSASRYVGPISETTVLYEKGHLAAAERVMRSLRGTVVLGRGTPVAGATVSVVTGSDLSVVRPRTLRTQAASASGSTTVPPTSAASPPASVVPITSTVNPNFGTPTPASAAIPIFDPRACPTKA